MEAGRAAGRETGPKNGRQGQKASAIQHVLFLSRLPVAP
jgi:hypothetical protein